MVHKKIQKHIEIARSANKALSSMSQKSADAIYELLKAHYATVGITTINNVSDLGQLVAKQPDLVFMGMKYVHGLVPGTKVWISEYLEENGISHTGSPKSAIEYEQDKPLAKQRVLNAGFKTSQFVVVKNGETFDATDSSLQFPLFVKPVNLGAGQGVDDHSIVRTQKELDAKIAALAGEFGCDALVEEFLSGREYSVAVLKQEYSEALMVMPLELVAGPNADGHRILSYELKSAPLETPTFPVTDMNVRAALIELATNAFVALGARDYGRIDIRMSADGVPNFLEANLIPCLIRGSGNFPKACAMNIDMDYDTMILHIVRLGLARTAIVDITEDEADTIAIYGAALPAAA
jgi:D-alanine-D-alanine ligase